MLLSARKFLLLVLAALSMSLPMQANAGDTLERVIDFKVLKVGMSADQPPMTMLNRKGNLMGFDVDLAKALAVAMGVRLEIKAMPFGDLMDALEAGQVDMVLSGMAITLERTEKASFVGPYMMSGKSILTKDSVLGRITSTEEFNKAEVRLVTLRNSTSASFANTAAPDATLIEVDTYSEGIDMLLKDKADALVAEMPTCLLAVLRYPEAGFTTLEGPLTVEPIGIAVSKNDPQFFNLVDNYLRTYEKSGVLTKLREKWFEDSSWIEALPDKNAIAF